jgi:nucleotide-binding universal stress UspA family protein
MKKILVPTDFSEEAENAICAAHSLAVKTNSEIVLLHVLDDPIVRSEEVTGETHRDPMEKVYVLKLIERSKEKLQAIVDEDRFNDVNISWKLKKGNAFQSISEAIGEVESSLVIMGTKGAGGLQELLVGSVADKVVRYANCPVITVKKCRDLTNANNIVFATDLKDDQASVIDDLKLLQEYYGAKLHIVKVYDSIWLSKEEVEKRINEFAARMGLKDYTVNVVEEMDEAYGILKFARELDADMIAMGTHDRHGLLHLLAGHVSKDVVNHAHRPIWTKKLVD